MNKDRETLGFFEESDESPPSSDKEYCESCNKPLGNSADGVCHECGGETYRAGREKARKDRVRVWRGLIGR